VPDFSIISPGLKWRFDRSFSGLNRYYFSMVTRLNAMQGGSPRVVELIILSLLTWSVGVASVSALASLLHYENAPVLQERFPNFDRFLLLEATADLSSNVSLGDVNNDGYPDIVIARGAHSPLVSRVFLNDGHGHFTTAHDLSEVPARSFSAQLADVTRNGNLAVVVGNDAPDKSFVYLNDGTGHFHVGSTFGRAEWTTRNVAVADLNGDGWPDIVVANRAATSEGANYVCLNRGDGNFDTDCILFSHESATTITPADFSNDGYTDLAVPNRDGGQSYVYLNDGKAHFLRRIPFGPPDARIRMVAAADLTGEGRLDIVAVDERHGTSIFFNQGDGTFSAAVPLGTSKATPFALATADLRRDGKIDVVVGYANARPIVYFNDGSGHKFTAVPFGDDQGIVFGIAIGDLDGDGWPDVVLARYKAPSVVYFSSGLEGSKR
jgi:hypothetical protein